MPERDPGGEYEELRVALVMNGGVSLAVWIGGVTFEVGRLLAGSPRYAALCGLVRTRPVVDVIAGTSAGGINGAYLALCIACHQREALLRHMADLRGVWVDKASFDALLRGPFERKPVSLLDGDGYFHDQLKRAFGAIVSGAGIRPAGSMELIVTTTLLQGERGNHTDDFGVPVEDVSHRATLHFSRDRKDGDRRVDDFADPAVGSRLALAARCTSSFPVAFEPSFCPVGQADADAAARPDLAGVASFSASGFVLDGGILDNKPLDIALREIFRRPARAPTRRVLAYVVPDPGATAAPAAKPPRDGTPEPPDTLSVLLDSMVRIPSVQSVSAQLDAIRSHNQRVRDRRHARVLLTRYNAPDVVDAMSSQLFEAYCTQRLEAAIDYVVERMESGLAEAGKAGFRSRGRREWIHDFMCEHRSVLPWLPRAAPMADRDGVERRDRPGACWRWGTRPVEHSSRLLLDVLGRCQRLARKLPGLPGSFLSGQCDRAYVVLEEAASLRERDDHYWSEQGKPGVALLGSWGGAARQPGAEAEAWLLSAMKTWIGGSAEAAGIACDIADVLLGMRADMDILAASVPETGARLDKEGKRQREEWTSLSTLYGYFVRPGDGGDAGDTVVSRLLAFEVVQEAMGGRGTFAEEEIEFIQISGEGRSSFGGPEEAAGKLAGVQLAHFGAFYKESWRANDWMWGRVDAVRRLVRLLLDPERLRIVSLCLPSGRRADRMADEIAQLAAGPAEDLPVSDGEKAALRSELLYLDDGSLLLPEFLATAVSLVCRSIELEILRDELPKVYCAMDVDSKTGAKQRDSALRFRAEFDRLVPGVPMSGDQVRLLLSKCAIGEERLDGEVGTDRLTQTAAQTATLMVGAVARQEGWLKGLGRLLTLLRQPSLLLYLFARNARYSSGTTLALNVAMFTAGALVLVSAGFAKAKYPLIVLSAAWAALAAGGLFLLVRIQLALRLALCFGLVSGLLAAWKSGLLVGVRDWFVPWEPVAIGILVVLLAASLLVGSRTGRSG